MTTKNATSNRGQSQAESSPESPPESPPESHAKLKGHIALFQPDIPQNTGAIMRLASCFDMTLNIIEPCGFVFSEKQWKRSAMDYAKNLHLNRHDDWQEFLQWRDAETEKNPKKRIILFTTKGNHCYDNFTFQKTDILLFGSETKGVPENVHEISDATLVIPMAKSARSLNLAMSVAIAVAHFNSQLRKENNND